MTINIFAFGSSIQPTSSAMLLTNADIFTPENVRQSTPTSATIITTPPTFAGIVAAAGTVDGAINISWGSFSSVNLPVEFQVYIALGSVSATTLFALSPVAVVPSTATNCFVTQLSDQTTYLIKGLQYTCGVRCKDGVGNQNTNLVIATAYAIGSANLVSVLQTLAISLETTEQDLAQDHVDFQTENGNLVASIADLDASNVTLAAIETDLQTDVNKVETAANLIITTVL